MSSRTQEMIEWLVENGYTPEIKPEGINRFIDGTMKNEYVCHEDALQVASLLAAVMDGIRAGDDMNVQLRQILHLRKDSAGKFKFDPKTAYPGSLAYDIVRQHLNGEIKRVEAIEKFVMEVFEHEEELPDSRTVERWIDAMKPRVKMDLERLESTRLTWERIRDERSKINDK